MKLPLGGLAKPLRCGIDAGEDRIGRQAGRASGRLDHGVAFNGVHKRSGGQQPLLVFRRDRQEAVLVGMDELARLHLAAKHRYRHAPPDRHDVRMADAQPAGERLESGGRHLVHVADRAVGDRTHAAEGPVDV